MVSRGRTLLRRFGVGSLVENNHRLAQAISRNLSGDNTYRDTTAVKCRMAYEEMAVHAQELKRSLDDLRLTVDDFLFWFRDFHHAEAVGGKIMEEIETLATGEISEALATLKQVKSRLTLPIRAPYPSG
jgi:hypothetical protein